MGTLRASVLVYARISSVWIALGCTSPPPAESPLPVASPPPAASEAAPKDAPEPPSPGPTSEATAEESPSAPAAPPAPPGFVALCNQMCDRVAQRCSESAADGCRMNCTQYEHPPAGCDGQVRLALECAAKAEDLTCVNIAPESCAGDFRRVVACASGKPEGAMPEDPTKVPDDWQTFQSASHGFSAPLPPGVTETPGAPEPTYTVTSDGATYSVRVLEAPKEPTQKNLVRVVNGLVGKCTKGMKLYSMVERPERVTINFRSGCPGDAELSGFLVIAGGKMYVLEVQAPRGGKAPKDPFFYGFELRSAS